MMYYKLDWPRYEKAIQVATELKLHVTSDDFCWCSEPPCGFISERMYELVKTYI
jgi:hypothetical protein